ncbi:MAG TPA: carboxypeptidase-like regulatory domain-containing protein [Trueperaceae bacterium]|nr:carboxypeptidase-like regulatory domain-containing protein [Trueperaceae bacterium]
MIAERGLAHIDQVDDFLVSWASGVLDGAEVTVGAPTPEDHDAVSLHLLEIRPRQAARGATPAPLKIMLRYLVSAWSQPPAKAHRQLGSLAFAVLADDGLEFDPLVPPGTWRELGVPPRAGFVLGVELVRPREAAPAPLVEHQLEVADALLQTISGRVTMQKGTSVPGVVVEAAGSSRRVVTGNDGRFLLRHLAKAEPPRLWFVAKGRRCALTSEGREATGVPLDFEDFVLLLDYRYQD